MCCLVVHLHTVLYARRGVGAETQVYCADSVAVYEVTCKELGKPVDSALLAKMKEQNAKRMAEIEAAITDAKENEGETEVRDGLLAKAQLLARTGSKEEAEAAYDEAEKLPKTTSGQKLDVQFHLMRIGMCVQLSPLRNAAESRNRHPWFVQLSADPWCRFWGDIPQVEKHVKAAQVLIDQGGDWERRFPPPSTFPARLPFLFLSCPSCLLPPPFVPIFIFYPFLPFLLPSYLSPGFLYFLHRER